MIGQLTGTVSFSGEDEVIFSVNGVGYRVHTTSETSRILGQETGTRTIWTHHHVREDSQELYGFLDKTELKFFERLIKISGIGPRSALSILGVAPIASLRVAIGSGDTSYLTKISGIGKKTAEKIVLELRDVFSNEAHTLESKDDLDALDALHALGYSEREAREALRALPENISGARERIREALKYLSRESH